MSYRGNDEALRKHGDDGKIIDIKQAQAAADRDKAAAKADAADKSSLGSFKLSWLESIMSAYPEIDNAALRVGLCIALALNQRRWAYISTKAISDRTGISVTRVKVALAKLRDHGWLIWKRTRDANVYKLLLLDKNQIDIEARQTNLSDRGDEARKTKRRRFRDSP
jgi:hypothetical protein